MRLKWKLDSVRLQKLFWTHPMELQGYVGHMKSRFDLFGHSVSVSAR
jgi:hypothetical protein